MKENEARPIAEWTWIDLTRDCQLRESYNLLLKENADDN